MIMVDSSLHCLVVATGQVGLVSDPLSTGSTPCFYSFRCCYKDKDQSEADIEMPLDVPRSDLYLPDTCLQTARKDCSRCQPMCSPVNGCRPYRFSKKSALYKYSARSDLHGGRVFCIRKKGKETPLGFLRLLVSAISIHLQHAPSVGLKNDEIYDSNNLLMICRGPGYVLLLVLGLPA